MIQAQVRRSGNSFVVTLPKDEVERLGLVEGQFVALEVTPLELRPVLRPELRSALDAVWPKLAPALQYLKDR